MKKEKNEIGFLTDENTTEAFYVTLTDLASGKDIEFKVVSEAVLNGKRYFALVPPEEKGDDVIVLSVTGKGEDLIFETIEDDNEYEEVEDYFNDLLFGTSDYDN